MDDIDRQLISRRKDLKEMTDKFKLVASSLKTEFNAPRENLHFLCDLASNMIMIRSEMVGWMRLEKYRDDPENSENIEEVKKYLEIRKSIIKS